MLVIRVSMNGGVKTSTIVEGDFQFQRVGWGPWAATHGPSGAVFEPGMSDLDDTRRAVRDLAPDLFPTTPAPTVGSYTVARGRQSAARPGRGGTR